MDCANDVCVEDRMSLTLTVDCKVGQRQCEHNVRLNVCLPVFSTFATTSGC